MASNEGATPVGTASRQETLVGPTSGPFSRPLEQTVTAPADLASEGRGPPAVHAAGSP